ncbi:MAG: ABC transporter ATP-binding protein [Planctomycetes bacterium]|nr:ABC transporter ATP-binding protein [Planctomycetota bacterium]
MSDVELREVTKTYPDSGPGGGRGAAAVRDVSLLARDGEILTVLGPSGCGKSTLLRLVAGLERPDSGEIRIGGEAVNDREPRDRDVAMVFQSYALYPHMTAYENAAVALRIRRVPEAEVRRRVEEAADRLGIRGLLDRRPARLSGGERQRVALARALVRSPRAFLLDEPLSNLDAQLRERARSELRALFQQLRATVLYVTHDQVEALTLSHRIAVLQTGRIEQVGSPEDIYARPASLFVAGFVGSPRMNFLPGDLLPGGAHTLGVRPEDVTLAEDAPLSLSVVLRESLGAQQLWTLRSDRLELRVLVPAARATAQRVHVDLDPARVHRFDAQGRRLG